MRIHHHVSILHIVSIAGATGLAAATWMLVLIIQSAQIDGVASDGAQRRIGWLLQRGQALQEELDTLPPDATPEDLSAFKTTADRWMTELVLMRSMLPPGYLGTMELAITPLGRMLEQDPQPTVSKGPEPQDADGVNSFRLNTNRYNQGLDQILRHMTDTSRSRRSLATRHQRLALVAIGLLCVVYLAMVEHTRHWTSRRLVRPVEQLAEAAIQAMDGQATLSDLEHYGTKELNDLAGILSTFIVTLKKNVDDRTAQLEQQKERLEHEVTIRRQAERELRHAAFHDRLTGLCNRDLLMDRTNRCVQRSCWDNQYHFAVLFLDIDRFKQVNDSLGHAVGDQLLVEIAGRLDRCLRATDTSARIESNTVSRIGGDEFVVLLEGMKMPSDATLVADRIRQAFGEPFQLNGQEVVTNASIGIASSQIVYHKPDHLLRDADTAMYHAKAAGRARYMVFNQQMHENATANLKLVNDLHRAVTNNEFEVYYQPVVAIGSGRITGFEALLRWNHPHRGMILPAKFIRRAETAGLIVQLDQMVLERACQQLADWRQQIDTDPDLSVSVNVSKRQVAEPGVVDLVRRVLQKTGLPGTNLHLEITEIAMMTDPDSIVKTLRQVRALGVRIHMDDFGTGYSSLSHLHRFPLDLLKIERQFISTMNAKTNNARVVQAVIALAHQLGLEVTIEGVESHEQFTQLTSLGCDYAQGYYFWPPLDAGSARELITGAMACYSGVAASTPNT